jgi:sugar lactone lactonase YvrE
MSVDLSVVVEKYAFLEGPRWHDGRLWLSDFFMGVVVSVDPPGEPRVEAEVPNGASGTGWLPDGRLLVVSMRDRRVLRREPDGTLVEHADLSHVATGWCNDMVVDRKGRAYVGNFGYDLMAGEQARPAPLVRVDPDGTTTVATQGLKFPNGSVVIGDVLVVGETNGNRLSAFDIAPDGALGPRRDWAAWDPAHGRVAPDGICADAEGAIWVADPAGNRAIRVREGGEIVQVVEVGTGVYACALGGADRRTLFLCAAPGFHERDRRDTREAEVLALRVDVPGV